MDGFWMMNLAAGRISLKTTIHAMKRFLTESEINYIRERFADTPTAEIASALGFHYHTVSNKAYSMGLKKSEDYLRSEKCGRLYPGCRIGAKSQFKKGQESWNKGKRLGKEWTKGRMAETQFKAGRLPHNTREGNGALSKRSGGYWYVRISLGKWRQLHTHTWEKANRPINPKTEMVKFIVGF